MPWRADPDRHAAVLPGHFIDAIACNIAPTTIAGGPRYQAGHGDDLLRALWVSKSAGEAFASYDGGADLNVTSPERVVVHPGVYEASLPSRADEL